MEPRVVDRFTRLALSPEPKLQQLLIKDRIFGRFRKELNRERLVGKGL